MSKNSDRKLRRYGIVPNEEREQQARDRLFNTMAAAPDGLRRDYVNTTISHIRGEGATIQGKDHTRDLYHAPRMARTPRISTKATPMDGQYFGAGDTASIKWQINDEEK